MGLLGRVRFKLRYCYYWLTGVWHVLSILKEANFNFDKWNELTQEYADSIKNRRKEIEASSDFKLQEIFLAKESSRFDRALANQTYRSRHGVSIYLDIAIADTDKFLLLQEDPKFEDPDVQEAYFAARCFNLLDQVAAFDKNKSA